MLFPFLSDIWQGASLPHIQPSVEIAIAQKHLTYLQLIYFLVHLK